MSEAPISKLWNLAGKLGRGRADAKPLPALLFFTDPERTPDPASIIAELPRGAGVVYRAFGRPDAKILGRALRQLARQRGVLFLVGADVPLAVALRADGIHWPQRLAARKGVNLALGRRFRLTAAAHDLPAILSAGRAGVEAVVVSPVFNSRSASAGRPLGPMRFSRLIRQTRLRAYALGGVNARTARHLGLSGACGLAVVDGLEVRAQLSRSPIFGPKT